jgi:gamma-carbonic anhydrase
MIKRTVYLVGHMFREAGEVLEKIGCTFQGDFGYQEKLNRHRRVMNYMGNKPQVKDSCFISPSSAVIGKVILGKGTSVWYNAVLRGDVQKITIGENTNIQERVVVHGNSGVEEEKAVSIGKNVTIGFLFLFFNIF